MVKQKGIHAKIDSFPEQNGLTAEVIARGLKAKAIEDVWGASSAVKESHAQVERCYELDRAGAFDKSTDEARTFILERCQAGRAADRGLVVHGLAAEREDAAAVLIRGSV